MKLMSAARMAGVVCFASFAAACSGGPTSPRDRDATTHVLHIRPAASCGNVWPSALPEGFWDVPFEIAQTSTGFSGSSHTDIRDRFPPTMGLTLTVDGARATGTLNGSYSLLPNLMLEVSQFGSVGFVAAVSGNTNAGGTTAGTFNGRIGVFDARADPFRPTAWIYCDSAEHQFTLSPV